MLVERWILDYALRNNFVRVVRELEGSTEMEGSDAYWLVSALRIIVFERQFAKFPVAQRIVHVLTRALPNQLIEEDEAFQLKFFLKLMSVLNAVGHSSAAAVVQLLRETFDSTDDEDNLNELRTDISDNTFKAVRRYVLRLLLKDARQRHFADRKFPDSFPDVLATIDAIATKLIDNAWLHLPSCKVEMLAGGSPVGQVVDEVNDADDPGVALFVEAFGERKPSECELIAFLQQIKDSQLSLTPPDLFAPFSRRTVRID
uniref:Uncharacterized protein n=1 Tax=Plectus sambesii TaxID=2011161 RepID=A0A914XNE0_9BILA